MDFDPSEPNSFSARRRWSVFCSVVISMIAVLALVVMVNYLAARHFTRLNWSTGVDTRLSPQTLGLLKSITNEVKVTVYYDKHDKLYRAIDALLNEYQLANRKISVQTVDYLLDSGMAAALKEKYKDYLGQTANKNLIIFDCNGRTKIIQGDLLADYQMREVPNDKQLEFERSLRGFFGEMAFSAALFGVVNPKPLTACLLDDHCDHPMDESTNYMGYAKFKAILMVNDIQPIPIQLEGSNNIPTNCNLLVIAGPKIIPSDEVAKIRAYLDGGGRLFVLFNYNSRNINTGLELLLAEWGVEVGHNQVIDLKHSSQPSGQDIIVDSFTGDHPLVSPFQGEKLELVLPRSISRRDVNKQGADAPKVDELAYSSPEAEIWGIDDHKTPARKPVPLMVAVERGGVKGVFVGGKTTRIVVAGDSAFLDNQMIEAVHNRAFGAAAVNWLLDQTQLLQGIGPHPVTEYKLVMTREQMSQIRWVFLAVMPGAVLAFGGLVWLRRRH